ncbi:carbohydrate ABC transporter permease [Cohnella silvisoli]|uniref:Carbohydrate ABC transporter permease n=1 Tax=Cohnella silvisoli TaxID=2873699 RepID=A0ABV1L2H1_9BACL|nr:carbohydrate ABC transporter permease [Cohnella silvisoli]MCD9025797.1 carbohydrate ABC transporter permease [Cohnella silvisoli]
MYYKSKSYQAAYLLIIAFLAALTILCILPMIHVLAVSFSGKAPSSGNLVFLWPKEFTVDAYQKTFGNERFIRSLLISIERSALGVSLGMTITLLTAYPLSKSKSSFGRQSVYMWFFVITMLFNGGLVPTYIVIQKLHLLNSIWALILPMLVNVWNIILMLNFFRGIPKDLEEAALIDGAGQLRTLFYVYLPVSLPSIVTLSLFTLVTHWNAWFDGLIYLSNPDRWPLATLLQNIIVDLNFASLALNPASLGDISDRTVKAAQIFIGALPVLVVYPFLQKFFVKGVVIGAVKE